MIANISRKVYYNKNCLALSMKKLFSKEKPKNNSFNPIKPPPHPTVAEFYGTKFSESDIKKFLDPKAFIHKKDFKDYDGIDENGNFVFVSS